MGLKDLFIALADVFDGPEAIEGHAKQALLLVLSDKLDVPLVAP